MAAAGRPVVAEPHPPGGAVSLEVDSSRSSMTEISASRRRGGPGCPPLEEQEEHAATPPTGETNCTGLRDGVDPGEQQLSCTCGLVTTHTPSRQHELVENASLPVCRSHSGTSPLVGLGMPPRGPDSHTCLPVCPAGEKSLREAESRSALACKLPMQLQPCSIITTICRGATSGGPALKSPNRCACAASPKAEGKAEGVQTGDPPPSKCDETLRCGSFIHQGNFEDTFAAYCHPQPIPAPSQALQHQVEPSRDIQCVAAPPLTMNHLTLPRLISSVSETGLDAKHLLRCCSVNCSWVSMAPPGAGLLSQQHFGLEGCCSYPTGHAKATTRDMGTMTAHKQLRNVGVQTGRTAPPHVFPQVCLAEETQSETSCRQTPNSDSDGGGKAGGAPKSPVKEVKWDAEGMTWEVYGASVDPEELGLAIQKHLELQIKETATRAAKLTRQNTSTSRQSGGNGSERKRSRMMGSIRTPACCTRSTTSVD